MAEWETGRSEDAPLDKADIKKKLDAIQRKKALWAPPIPPNKAYFEIKKDFRSRDSSDVTHQAGDVCVTRKVVRKFLDSVGCQQANIEELTQTVNARSTDTEDSDKVGDRP